MWQTALTAAQSFGDREFVVDEHGQRLSFTDAIDRATDVAGGLVSMGIGPGSAVSWMLPTRIDALILTLALCRLSAVQNPILAAYGGRDLEFVLAQTSAEHFFTVDDELPTDPDAVLPPFTAPGPRETRWVFYTSGTTAAPKGARHTDASLLAGARALVTSLNLDRDDRVGMSFPVAHIGGCACWLAASLISGCTLLLTERFVVGDNVEYLRRERATIPSSGTVFTVAYLDAARKRPGEQLFPNVRVLTSGAAPKPPGLHVAVREELGGFGVMSAFGMTEAPVSTFTHFDDSDDVLDATEGRATEGVEVRVVDGELRLRGPQVMLGYVDSSLDSDAFDDDGFLRTGDLASLDEQGNVTITGRRKDIIIRGGENISASEIEGLLLAHPKVADVALIGVPDPRLGERACAVVVASDPSDLPSLVELTGFLRDGGLRVYALPERLEIVDALPRNATGKVLKHELRARYG
jgi:cyclohexanecarboxylate-CoA ligase